MKTGDNPLLKKIVRALEDRKSLDIQVLDVREIISYTDFLIICSGTSTTHVSSIVSGLEDSLPKAERPVYVNSSKDDSWWILDFVDMVVHVFKEDARLFYDVERLWGDAQKIVV